MSFSLPAIKTVEFTKRSYNFFLFQQTFFTLSFFFQEDFSYTEKALYQSRCLSKVYGPLFITGLEITAGQRTMSRLIVDLTCQTFVLPIMLTGQNSIVLKMKYI